MDAKKFLPIIVLACVGCTTTATMDRQTMNSMRINCDKKQEQIDFIQSQEPSLRDRWVNTNIITSWFGFLSSNRDGTYDHRMEIDNGSITNAVRIQTYMIEKACAN